MSVIKTTAINGTTDAATNNAVSASGPAVLRLPGKCNGRIVSVNLDEDLVSRHALLIGGTGSGKTNLMTRIVDQCLKKMGDNDVALIFDSKGDYYNRFFKCPYVKTYVLGNSPQYRDSSVKWNIFGEVLADGVNPASITVNAREIARDIFEERAKNTTNAFFPNAAGDLFASLLQSVCYDSKSDLKAKEHLTNGDFIHYLETSSPDELIAQLSAYEELRAVISYIEGTNEQSQGVISEMYSVIRNIFFGVFGDKGKFSIRRFIRSKGKKVLFLEYDFQNGSVLSPIYRLLIDLALKEALSQYNTSGNFYLFLDEFKLVPYTLHLDDAVNFGRSKGVKVFASLQSIEQLYSIYGETKGRCIAAGFSSVFAFHANDAATMRYISALYGQNLKSVEIIGSTMQPQVSVQYGNVIEDWVMSQLGVGDAIVCLPNIQPYRMHFDKFT